MHKLDDLKLIRRIDKKDMLSHIVDLPEQFSQAWSEAKSLSLPSNYIQFNNVVLLGMGASAIGGSFVKALLTSREIVPVTILRDYSLPAYVDRNSLVIAVTYSGNTEETVTTFSKAGEKGAKLIAITSDGEIERLASRFRAPIFKVSYGAEPRAALGYLFISLLAVFTRVGLVEFSHADMADVIGRMETQRGNLIPESPISKNPAKKLADRFFERLVVTIGNGALSEVARRWKTQINENAKQAAYFEAMPELCHNAIVGLDFPRWQSKQLQMVLLSSNFDHPRNRLRMKIFQSLLSRKNIPFELITINGAPNPVAELAQTVLLGDFVSYYLAILNGVDPTPVEPIERLKKELAKHT